MRAYHSAVFGDSGSGKTTLCREVHAETDMVSICVNYNGESDVAGYQASGYKSMQTGLEHYDTWSDVKLNLKGQMAEEEALSVAVAFATDLFDTAWQHPNFNGVQLWCPEFHRVVPDDGRSPNDSIGKWVLHEGRDKGIKLLGDTQTPQKLDYDAIKQLRYWGWCGEPAGIHDGFFNAHGWIPRDRMPTQDYQYVIMDKKGRIVYRDETSEKYARSMV